MQIKLVCFARNCCLAMALTSLVGCGDKNSVATAPVSGTVTIKGKPVEGVEVYFCSESTVAYGKTDAQGHYELVQNAAQGENKVYFNKIEGGASPFGEQEGIDDYQLQMMAEASGKKSTGPKQLVPAEFANPSDPKLSFNVPSGGSTTADFKL